MIYRPWILVPLCLEIHLNDMRECQELCPVLQNISGLLEEPSVDLERQT
jgi:hypothetical protein